MVQFAIDYVICSLLFSMHVPVEPLSIAVREESWTKDWIGWKGWRKLSDEWWQSPPESISNCYLIPELS